MCHWLPVAVACLGVGLVATVEELVQCINSPTQPLSLIQLIVWMSNEYSNQGSLSLSLSFSMPVLILCTSSDFLSVMFLCNKWSFLFVELFDMYPSFLFLYFTRSFCRFLLFVCHYTKAGMTATLYSNLEKGMQCLLSTGSKWHHSNSEKGLWCRFVSLLGQRLSVQKGNCNNYFNKFIHFLYCFIPFFLSTIVTTAMLWLVCSKGRFVCWESGWYTGCPGIPGTTWESGPRYSAAKCQFVYR